MEDKYDGLSQAELIARLREKDAQANKDCIRVKTSAFPSGN